MTDLSKLSNEELIALYQSMQPKPAADTLMDVVKSGGVGMAKGAIGLAGMPADIAELGARGIDKATQFIGGALGVNVQPRQGQEPSIGSASIQRAVEGITGPFYKPQTTAGQYAETAGEFVPAAIAGPGGIGRRLLTQAAAPALASEAAGQLTKGTAAEPYARIGGALAAPYGIGKIERALTPLPITAERQAAINYLKGEGVKTLTAGQESGRQGLKYAESALADIPFSGKSAEAINRQQGREFTQAALKRMGVTGDVLATDDVLTRGRNAISQKYQQTAANNSLDFNDPQLWTDIKDTMTKYDSLVAPQQQAKVVANEINKIIEYATTRSTAMPGTMYQDYRGRLKDLADRAAKTDEKTATALKEIRKALDESFGRALGPADKAIWDEANREWAAWKTLGPTMARAGEKVAEGYISPKQLRTAAAASDPEGYALGRGQFTKLAKSAENIMTPLPQSGTAPRAMIQSMAGALGGGLALGGAGLLPAAGAVISPAVIARVLMSKPVQGYLKNQRFSTGGNPNQAALLTALLSQGLPYRPVPSQ